MLPCGSTGSTSEAVSRLSRPVRPGKLSDPYTTAMDLIAAFARRSEFEKARALLAGLRLPYEVLSPCPGYAPVGAPALVCDSQGLSAIGSDHERSEEHTSELQSLRHLVC